MCAGALEFDICELAKQENLFGDDCKVLYTRWLEHINIEANKYPGSDTRESGFFQFIDEFLAFFTLHEYLFEDPIVGIRLTMSRISFFGDSFEHPKFGEFYYEHREKIKKVLLDSFRIARDKSEINGMLENVVERLHTFKLWTIQFIGHIFH